MNKDEAMKVLEQELANFRRQSYDELTQRIPGGSLEVERTGASGASYQIEIQFLWDNRPGSDVLVMGSIDDGGWRAFSPLIRSFIKRADGSFVGE